MTQHQRAVLKEYFPVLCIVCTCAMAFGATKMKLEDLDQRFQQKMQDIEKLHDKQDSKIEALDSKAQGFASSLALIDYRISYMEKHK